jgi:transcriptional regulator of arginine metabolism
MKNTRHAKILEIVNNEDIDTQELLSQRLRECGFDVTQATVSRDINQLGLVKKPGGINHYKYVAPETKETAFERKFINILKETVISADNAGNIIVIKTYPGMANAAAAAIDHIANNRIVGTIAGDDNIFAVTKLSEEASVFAGQINETLRK